MYYFDHEILGNYISTGVKLKAYVGGEYYRISGLGDVQNSKICYGSKLTGEIVDFDYRDIEHILVNGKTIDIDQLQKRYDTLNKEKKEQPKEKPDQQPKEKPDQQPKEKPDQQPEKGKSDQEPEKEKSKKPEESYVKLGSYILNDDINSSGYGERGSVVLKERFYVTYEYYTDHGVVRNTIPISKATLL